MVPGKRSLCLPATRFLFIRLLRLCSVSLCSLMMPLRNTFLTQLTVSLPLHCLPCLSSLLPESWLSQTVALMLVFSSSVTDCHKFNSFNNTNVLPSGSHSAEIRALPRLWSHLRLGVFLTLLFPHLVGIRSFLSCRSGSQLLEATLKC